MKRAATEFLFFLAVLILCIPLGLLFLYFLKLTSETDSGYMTDDESVFATELYLVGYIVCFVGIYLIRMIVGAIRIAVGVARGGSDNP